MIASKFNLIKIENRSFSKLYFMASVELRAVLIILAKSDFCRPVQIKAQLASYPKSRHCYCNTCR